MGRRNPDRVPVSRRRRGAMTVTQMRAQGWSIHSKCRTCGLVMEVDLTLIAKVSGPDTSLWNRHPRCRRLLCNGVVDFMGRAPDMNWHEVLDAPWPEDGDHLPGWMRGALDGKG